MNTTKELATEWKKVTKSPILDSYGLTEAAPVIMMNPFDGTSEQGTLGMPLTNTEVKVVNDKEEEVKVGEIGELQVKGP